MDRDSRFTKYLGGAVGGVSRDRLPQLVANLLAAHSHEIELTIHPERLPESAYYTVEWQFLEFNPASGWQPLGHDGAD